MDIGQRLLVFVRVHEEMGEPVPDVYLNDDEYREIMTQAAIHLVPNADRHLLTDDGRYYIGSMYGINLYREVI